MTGKAPYKSAANLTISIRCARWAKVRLARLERFVSKPNARWLSGAAVAHRSTASQVMLNLILNAVDAMSGSEEGSRELLISTEEDGANGVRIAVRDWGPGLNPESADRLFDAFYTTKPDGMGMGLSICRSIIEAHGGRVWATANLPRGAVLQFTLPLPGEASA